MKAFDLLVEFAKSRKILKVSKDERGGRPL